MSQLRTNYHFLLVNLALTELLTGLYGIPVDMAASLMAGWKLGRASCVLTGFLLTFLGNTDSSLNLSSKLQLIHSICLTGMNSVLCLVTIAAFRYISNKVSWDKVNSVMLDLFIYLFQSFDRTKCRILFHLFRKRVVLS